MIVKQRRRIAAYGVSHDADGRVLLVRGSAQDDDPGSWGLPGGGIEHGEAPRDAAVRRSWLLQTRATFYL